MKPTIHYHVRWFNVVTMGSGENYAGPDNEMACQVANDIANFIDKTSFIIILKHYVEEDR